MNGKKEKEKSLTQIDIVVTHLSDSNANEEVDNKWRESVRKKLVSVIRKVTNIADANLKLFSIDENKDLGKNYYEEDEVCRFNGHITCERQTIAGVKTAITKMCCESALRRTWFSLSADTLVFASNIDHMVTRNSFYESQRVSFQLGTIIDLTDFISHFDSNTYLEDLYVAKDDLRADFNHDRNRLLLYFRVTSGGNKRRLKNIRYKLEYMYSSMICVVICVLEDKIKFYFCLSHPPIVYVRESDIENEPKIIPKVWIRGKLRKPDPIDHGIKTDEPISKSSWLRMDCFKGTTSETVGKCNVLEMEIPQIKNYKAMEEKFVDLPDPWILIHMLNKFAKIPIYFANVCDHPMTVSNEQVLKDKEEIALKYAERYAYYSLFSHNFQISDELYFKNQMKDFIKLVRDYANCNKYALRETLFQLQAIADRYTIFRSLTALKKIFIKEKIRDEKLAKDTDIIKSLKAEMIDVRRCILTPTRLLILPPQPTLKSRFIVQSNPDYVIRLSVREDDLQGLQFTVRHIGGTLANQREFLDRVIKQVIMDGIKIGDRLFEFLGSSSSQLRDSGMVLYAEDPEGRTASLIRDGIGDLSKISRNVPKYVARLGLAFSQSMIHLDVPKEYTRCEKDILTETLKPDSDEHYIFSDGVGKISKDLAKLVYKKLPKECARHPSAMQIRFGGCKGMLVVDPRLDGRLIIFRESMRKYESTDSTLLILKLSAPRPLHLNRPLITILEQLGVSPKVFLRMLFDNFKLIAHAMLCECKAVNLLQDSSTLSIPYRKMFDSKIPFLSEPIFRQIVECVIQHRIRELKTKARIRVPMNMGRNVMGVLDETDSLDYGEVFIQITKVDDECMPTNDLEILNGEVMVTKFPCLHPGDVRKFKAVDAPELHHIKDCIVFPARGKRPHSDEMAGSDLDGDEYAIFWSPINKETNMIEKCDLIFDKDNANPMDFPSSKSEELDHDANVEDILNFYIEYILMYNVGIIANAHLSLADSLTDGIFSDICMNLAKKYSIALDFAKTGKVIPIERSERPRVYPNFMEKFSTKRTYLSNKVLGQIYMHCCRYEMAMQSDSDLEIDVQPNNKFNLPGWEFYKDWAKEEFLLYKHKIRYLLNRFGVDSEAALISGAFSKTSKYMTGRTETNDVHELLESLVNKLFTEFQTRFNEKCRDSTPHERRLRASSWYMITFEMNKLEETNESTKTCDVQTMYFGFPWTITKELCNIMKDSTSGPKNNQNHNCVKQAADTLDMYFSVEYIHKDPDEEKLACFKTIEERNMFICEQRFRTADVVLKAWLERQDHLFFKRKEGIFLQSNTDGIMSDMDRKLCRRLIAMKIDVMCKIRELKEEFSIPTAGRLVMTFFNDLLNEWLSVENLKDNNRVIDTPLVKFGFSALSTINHYFKTRMISHIVDIGTHFKVSIETSIIHNTFYIELPFISKRMGFVKAEMIRKFTIYIVQETETFCERLKHLTGIIEARMEPYEIQRENRYFYLLTASGTVWAIQALKNFIAHPCFFKEVPLDKWKKHNIAYTGTEHYEERLARILDRANQPIHSEHNE